MLTLNIYEIKDLSWEFRTGPPFETKRENIHIIIYNIFILYTFKSYVKMCLLYKLFCVEVFCYYPPHPLPR